MSFYLCVYGQIYVYAFAYTCVCVKEIKAKMSTQKWAEILLDSMKCMNDE